MNFGTPEPNRRVVVWDASDNYSMIYSDYLLCDIGEDNQVTILQVGYYDEAADEVCFSEEEVENYRGFQHLDFNELCTGFEDEFNDWAYYEDFEGPVFEENMHESSIKKFKEGITAEDVRDVKEEIVNNAVSEEEIDISAISDDELDTLLVKTYNNGDEEEGTSFFESVKTFVADMRFAESTEDLTVYALMKHYHLSKKEAEEMLADMVD